MDIVIESKKKLPIKKIAIIAASVVAGIFILQYLWYLGKSDFSVKKETLNFDNVKKGKYTVTVRGSGLLVPDNIQWLSANVEATVVRRVLKAGHEVKKGDLIVELENLQLVRQLSEVKWELEALEAELTAQRVEQESQIQQQKSAVLNEKLNYEAAVTEFDAHADLIKQGAVSKLAYGRTRTAMDQAKQRWAGGQAELAKLEENLVAQNAARKARLNQMKKRVERINQQVDDLQVVATIDGTILEVPLEEGQRVMMGDNIAKLAQKDSLIAELRVPEIQIRDVRIGQAATVDTRNNIIEGIVSRIDPAVENGTVQVDISFSGEIPDDARPDLSVDGVIKVTDIDNTLFVNRPLFSQSKSMASFYKVTPDGKFAERVSVKLGYGSVNEIEVLEGLIAGDTIITSDPTRFKSYDKFRIN